AAAPMDRTQALQSWAADQDDLTLLTTPPDLKLISTLNEQASMTFYRNAPYRAELLSWMRLKRSDPRFGVDGLSTPGLGLSAFEAFGAGIALSAPVFGVLDRLGLAAGLVSEAARTEGSSAILIFHRPRDEDPLDTGRHLYRRLLALTALDFFTWPMAVL